MKTPNRAHDTSWRNLLAPADIRFIKQRGANMEELSRQWRLLNEGSSCLHLERPCALDDGIVRFSEAELNRFAADFDAQRQHLKTIKFVPASGAASRMFTNWQNALDNGSFATEAENEAFLQALPRYAFYPLLSEALGVRKVAEMLARGDVVGLLRAILGEAGLGYKNIPKALLAFHRYGGAISVPLEEHLREAAYYCADGSGCCRVHFTVAIEHKKKVEAFLKETLGDYERIFKVKFLVDLSVQSPATDTIALDEKDRLARSADGNLLFRPGGHGALLENLQNLQADVIFIKNIDNVVHSSQIDITIKYKKALGGYLLKLLADKRGFQNALRGEGAEALIDKAAAFCAGSLNHCFATSFATASNKEKTALLQDVLARPLRVCGFVRNEAEPGGAPFWVCGADNSLSLQIIEGFQVDAGQQKIWQAAGYFNPVDIVCSINKDGGGVFDLDKFADKKTAFVTEKQDGGRNLRVLELPGLWNGAMARWNSVFVETPLATFNPVKIIEDLLRPAHCEK